MQEYKLLLEQKNFALKELISLIEIEKDKVKKDVATNVGLLFPILNKIKITDDNQKHYLKLIKDGLTNIVSTFGRSITQESFKLTSRELEICNLIKNGFTSKEIASQLHITSQTVAKHRTNIRRKIKITDSEVNLVTFLKSL